MSRYLDMDDIKSITDFRAEYIEDYKTELLEGLLEELKQTDAIYFYYHSISELIKRIKAELQRRKNA